MRSLVFNLKDATNPDLRARVLHGDLTPSALVRMGADDLANRELTQWRKSREEAHSKLVVLDAEAAAKVGGWTGRAEVPLHGSSGSLA